MKRICFSALFALFCASLLPSCGGGGDGAGDQFVSVQSFKSGSGGFYLIGSPSIRIIPRGDIAGTSTGKNPSPTFNAPVFIPEGFEGVADAEAGDMSCVVQGNMTLHNGSEITGCTFTYTVSADKRYGVLDATLEQDSGISSGAANNRLDALVSFLGFISPDDVQFTGWGSNNLGGTVELLSVSRVMLTTISGAKFRFWFDFSSNQAYVEVRFVGAFSETDASGQEQNYYSELVGAANSPAQFLKLNL